MLSNFRILNLTKMENKRWNCKVLFCVIFFNFKNCQDLVNEIFRPEIDLKFRKLTGKLNVISVPNLLLFPPYTRKSVLIKAISVTFKFYAER